MELFIFDLDDTLFKTTAKVIVRKKNNIMRKLSNAEYSNYQLQDHEYYDFSEFKDANINYNGDLTNNKNFSEKEWPRPLKSWKNTRSPTTLVPIHEDLEIMTKFFEVFAPKFEKVMRKHLLEIVKN